MTVSTMRMHRLIPAIAMSLVMAACSTMPGREGNVDAVLTASGIDAQLARLQQPLQPGKSSGPTMLIPDEWLTIVNTTVAESLKPEEIRQELHSALSKNLSSHELASVQHFYESETGRTVVALESGQTSAPGTTRLPATTLDELARTTGAGKAASMLAERALNDAVDIAFEHRCFGLDKVPFAGMLSGVIKKTQLGALRDSVNTSIRERYTGLTERDAEAYIDFARSPAGNKFFNTRTSVLTTYAGRAGDSLSSKLSDAVTAICKKP
ncbi:MAG: hypothetical protein Q7T32_03575 [Moraxellaceae bacterium]|nr:hypothetical protein [Moraxellaceae bacterium]